MDWPVQCIALWKCRPLSMITLTCGICHQRLIYYCESALLNHTRVYHPLNEMNTYCKGNIFIWESKRNTCMHHLHVTQWSVWLALLVESLATPTVQLMFTRVTVCTRSWVHIPEHKIHPSGLCRMSSSQYAVGDRCGRLGSWSVSIRWARVTCAAGGTTIPHAVPFRLRERGCQFIRVSLRAHKKCSV